VTFLPQVAILGRPNVGKSTLFNRLVGRRQALVRNEPGVTRDRQVGQVTFGNSRFEVVDTGGFTAGDKDALLLSVRRQAEVALEHAAVAVLVIDARAGLTVEDLGLASLLRRSGKPVLVAMNKLDDAKVEAAADWGDLYRLGLGEPFAMSAEHARGISDLLEAIVERLPESGVIAADEPEDEGELRPPRIALVGRPNVGKSTLLNRLLGEERVVVSPEAGTTRDSIEVELTRNGRRYVVIDTAGLRRRGHASGDELEQLTAAASEEAMARADVVLAMMDSSEPAVEQDARLVGMAFEHYRPLLLLFNKVDLIPARDATKRLRDALSEGMRFALDRTPMLQISALQGTGIDKILPAAWRLHVQASTRISTPEINRFLQEAEEGHPPPRSGGYSVRLYYAAQVTVRPPTFVFHANRPEGVPTSYRRYLANSLRDRFGLEVPVKLVFRRRERSRRAKKPPSKE
jgi:GTP-binding protein